MCIFYLKTKQKNIKSIDCTDGSDETVTECISFQCSDSKFRCSYGACVNKTSECNGVKDCSDNSGNLAIFLFFFMLKHLKKNNRKIAYVFL